MYNNDEYTIRLLTDKLCAYNDFDRRNQHPLYHRRTRHLPDADDQLELVSGPRDYGNDISIRNEIVRVYPEFMTASNTDKWRYIRRYLLGDAIANIYETCKRINWRTLPRQSQLDYKFLLGRIAWLMEHRHIRSYIRNAYNLDTIDLHAVICNINATVMDILTHS
jgi:hypothetical protein